MAKRWSEVEQNPEYQKLSDTDKQAAKEQYFRDVVSVKPEFKSLSANDQTSAKNQFFGQKVTAQEPKKPEGSIATQGIDYIKEHPVKTAFEPVTKTLTGKTAFEHLDENTGMQPFVNNADLYGSARSGRPMTPTEKVGLGLKNAETIASKTAFDTAAQMTESATAPAAILGGPLVAAAVKSPVVKQGAQAIANSPVGQTVGKVLNADIGKAVAQPFKDLSRSASNYVTDVVAPKAYKLYQDSVNSVTPQIEKFAINRLGAPKSAVDSIKQYGVQNVSQTRAAYNNSTDGIYQKIEQGIAAKDKAVEDAYSAAFSKVPDSAAIPLTNTKRAMGGLLRKAGYIDRNNKVTGMGELDTNENSALNKVLGFYKSLGTGEGQVTGVTPFQWKLFRSNLSKAAKGDKQLSGEIKNILDSLHADAEKAGVKGIQNARALARQNFDAEDRILNSSLIKERKLDNYHKLTEDEKRNLDYIQRYTGVNFIDDLKKISAGKYLDKLQEYNPDRFVEDLNKAFDPKFTNHIKGKYTELLGKQKADEIFNDIISSRRGKYIKTGAIAVGSLGVTAGGGKVIHDALNRH